MPWVKFWYDYGSCDESTANHYNIVYYLSEEDALAAVNDEDTCRDMVPDYISYYAERYSYGAVYYKELEEKYRLELVEKYNDQINHCLQMLRHLGDPKGNLTIFK